MKSKLITLSLLLFSVTCSADNATWGNSLHQMVRLQTVDPLAENRVPQGSPTFSGKKATKSFNLEQKGNEQKKIKNKDIISGIGD
ncbi:hypothetical protein C9I99_02995 [Photobacterium lutimaris]|uniref:Uncharacterized protein n=1 Tax=Photobacterium lutimaris TaxID=388278 RepID=A0A2T3J3Y9_9GAMM|nr:hypothetical protein C9I99_02995 [Photobacterium lutimaris]